jgi:5-methylcytosine-specific restriction enzyme subunit McrC
MPIELSRQLKSAIKKFDSLAVSDMRPQAQMFRQVQLHRSNAFYAFLLHLCELVHKEMFPTQNGKSGQFASLLEDETRLDRIFERFVRNFFKQEQRVFRVGAERIEWDISLDGQRSPELLPCMNTDISLRSRERTIIIDTKFYSQTLSSRFERKGLRSDHLYQLFTYVKNLERREGPDRFAEGILLYPTVQQDLDHSSLIQGHRITARTVDLSKHWFEIKARLLSLLEN